MVCYDDHTKCLPEIKTAIKDYLTSKKSQDACAHDHGLKLSVFKYYYHNARFMEMLKKEMDNENNNKKNKERHQKNPEDLIREIFAPGANYNKTDSDKKIKIKVKKERNISSASASNKIKTLSEKNSERPPSAHRSNSANKYTRNDSNIDIDKLLTKPTPLPF